MPNTLFVCQKIIATVTLTTMLNKARVAFTNRPLLSLTSTCTMKQSVRPYTS